MKKLLLITAIAVFGITAANAQTEKGNWTFGGSSEFSFSSNTTKEEFEGEELGESKTSELSFTVDGGYFVINNLSVGLELRTTSTKETYEVAGGEDEYKTTSFAILPHATYFFKTESSIAPFVGTKVGYVSVGGEDDIDKYSGLAFGVNAGLAYFINKNISVDLKVEYLNTTLSNKEENEYKIKNSGIGAGVGFSIYF